MNPLDDRMVTCTVGELLVQLRLLEYDVQAAPPLVESLKNEVKTGNIAGISIALVRSGMTTANRNER